MPELLYKFINAQLQGCIAAWASLAGENSKPMLDKLRMPKVNMSRAPKLKFLPQVHLIILLLLSSSAFATHTCGFGVGGGADAPNTCYVSSAGLDTNTGVDKAHAWAHLPGMLNATGNAASQVPIADDIYILKGGDTWANASFPVHWTWSGSSGHPITIDRDVTWFSGASWNRAIFSAGAAVINNTAGVGSCHGAGLGKHYFVYFDTVTFVTMNYVEATGLFWDTDEQGTCFQSMGTIAALSSDNLTVDNWYLHNWTHANSAGVTDSTATVAYLYNAPPYCTACTVQNFVVDNSDGDGTSAATRSGGGVQGWNLKNSVFKNVVQMWHGPILTRPSTLEISGNNCTGLGLSFTTPTQSSPPHPNCIETTGVVNGSSGVGTVLVHDNYIHNNSTMEGLQVGNLNEDDYVWNNIWDNPNGAGDNGPQVPQGNSGSHNFYFWNNTVHWSTGCMTAGIHSTTFTNFVVQNNHCINDGTTIVSGSIPGSVINNNVGMTNATATSQGYTNSETYVYSPTAGTNGTVGAGTNLTSTSPGCGTSGLSSLCSDTVYAVSEQTVSGVVTAVASGRATIPRPSGATAWDSGAFMLAGLSFSPSSFSYGPQAISTTSAGQTVSITNNSGSTITLTSEVMQTGTNYAVSSNTCGASLLNGASCSVAMTFTPLSAGTLTDNLVVTSSGTGSPQSVPLTGIGLASPVISPATGSYSGAQTASITDATAGTTIYYTLDGSTPDNTKTLYSGSFLVSTTTTVKAIAILSGVSSGQNTSVITITGTNNNLTTTINHVKVQHVVID